MKSNIDEDLAEFAIDYAKNVDYIEVRIEREDGNSLTYKNGVLEGASFGESEGMSVRIINGGIGFASTNSLSKESIRAIVDSARKMASIDDIGKGMKLAGAKIVEDSWEVPMKIDFPNVEEKMEFLREIDRALLDSKAAVMARLIQLDDYIDEKYYANSEGTRISSKIPRCSLFYLISIGKTDSEQMSRQYGNSGGWEFVNEWKVERDISRDASILQDLIKKGKKPPQGKMDVILAPMISGLVAHESCGHPCEADRILGREAAQAGKSFIKEDMLGQKIGGNAAVIDDPLLPNSYGYYKYDDEGIGARKRYLMKNGEINEFLQNRETAFLMNTNSNASARASSFDREPIVRMANTYIEPGDHSFEELLEGVKYGVYMASFMEWNIDDKRYDQKYVGEEAYLVKDGEIGYLIKHPVLEITTPSFYKSIDAVGNDLEFYAATCGKGDPMQGIPVWTGGPSVRLKEVRMI